MYDQHVPHAVASCHIHFADCLEGTALHAHMKSYFEQPKPDLSTTANLNLTGMINKTFVVTSMWPVHSGPCITATVISNAPWGQCNPFSKT